MVQVKCTFTNCDYQTENVSEALAIALLGNHGLSHQNPIVAAPAPAHVFQGPKLERPKVDIGVTNEGWNVFVRRWDVFRTGSGIGETSAPSQLFQCASQDLGDSLLKTNPNAATSTLPQLLEAMRSLAVIPVATGVLRTELLKIHQERDEPFRAFTARVRGKAETCAFKAKCECGKEVDYTDHAIRDVLLNGIADAEIRRETLGTLNILTTSINDVVALVENKEMARNAQPSSALSAMSTFRRQRNEQPAASHDAPPLSQADRTKQASCPDCKSWYKVFTEGARGWNKKPHQVCISCYRTRRGQRHQRPASANSSPSVQALESISQIAVVQSREGTPLSPRRQRRRRRDRTTHGPVTLDHHVFTKGEWKKARLLPHPRIKITISAAERQGTPNQTPTPTAHVSAIADTGAQSDLWSLSEYLSCGFSRDALRPVTIGLTAANRSPISIEGAFFANLQAAPVSGKTTSCRTMLYVSSSVQSMYLSYESMLNLGILTSTFPSGESQPNIPPMDRPTPSTNAALSLNDGCRAPSTPNTASCSCPQRDATPPRPTELPFPCTAQNNGRMKAWLLDRYASSTFNTCPHRPLPCMEGPPIEIHIDPEATPKASHTPASVPLHWQEKVYEDLLRDEALGVIERVPYGEPVTWCHRMVVTRKHDGSPRRTVDLSPLNRFCKRETFAMESPFQLARRVPKDTWKTVTDAWNGYHSVPLRPSDKHLTTFITPFGRWRYTRAPQGFLSSGDGYNRRFDAVLSNVERKERCVDDTIHYDRDLEEHWWRTIDLLTRIGQAGIVLNAHKFQFAEKSVDFAGFRISESTIEPQPKYLDAIRDFPSPTSTTDIRSWFGLVNQVANYAQLRDTMAPFKPFLSARCKFTWSSELEEAFQTSKAAIITAIRKGVEIFDIQRRTCLRPDWSQRGIGYFLLQQHCTCSSGIPDCCTDGWRITLAGSRFLSPAEQRYAAIEGEALAVAWGLEQTRYFTQGCDKLVVVTDHKPLVKILGDRTLDEITNSRLFRLKQRVLPWRFEVKYLPGKSNLAADATSRHPSLSGNANSSNLPDISDLKEWALMASIRSDVEELGTLTWSRIAQETARDTSLSSIVKLIDEGSHSIDRNDSAFTPLWTIRDSVYTQEGVLLYDDRVLIPESLRQRVLQHLHAAHQGTSTMEQRARAIVYWPGMTNDIRSTRERCRDCNRNAPSQAATPPLPSPPPSTPFEAVFADFFTHGGSHYLVAGDRLSGWVEIFSSPVSTNLAGAAGLVRHLRSFFATFGVPEELSSDGGPEFTAGQTEAFLRLWGVRLRLSSAYFPQSNGRAEVAVKTAKRLLMSNTSPTGGLDHDGFLRAILQLRNTPDPDCNFSPAQIIFGRNLRDTFSFVNKLEKFSNPNIRPLWRDAWAAKEQALRTRMTRTTESLSQHSRPLRPLAIGESVFLQNQHGNSPTKWDRSGTVIESLNHDQYQVKVDGSGRLTLRNRRFLRAFTPATRDIGMNPPPPPLTSRHDGQNKQSSTIPLATGMQNHTLNPPSEPVVVHSTPKHTSETIPDSSPAASVQNPRAIPQGSPPQVTDTAPASDMPIQRKLQPQATQQEVPRPRRECRTPKRYEPETGNWI